jgi:hypothetical protein
MQKRSMTDPFDDSPQRSAQSGDQATPSADILIGRIVDGEATLADREQFDELAASNPSLWQTLAHRQQDMMVLSARMDESTRFADHVELPLTLASGAALRRPWLWAFSGWAALLVVGLFWGLGQLGDGGSRSGEVGRVSMPPVEMTPDDHLREYLKAPFVTGQFPATLTYTQELSDGRLAMSFVRRIEETVIVNPDQSIDMDDSGNLNQDPAELRKMHDEPLPKPTPPQ